VRLGVAQRAGVEPFGAEALRAPGGDASRRARLVDGCEAELDRAAGLVLDVDAGLLRERCRETGVAREARPTERQTRAIRLRPARHRQHARRRRRRLAPERAALRERDGPSGGGDRVRDGAADHAAADHEDVGRRHARSAASRCGSSTA
jgi:hypothetical protein